MGGYLFDYIAGAASILSLLLALLPYFQRYKQVLALAFAFTLGMLVGSLAAKTSASSVVLSFQGSIFQASIVILALMSAFIVLILIISFALSSDVSSEVAKSKGLAGSASFGFFLFLSIIYGISSCAGPGSQRSIDDDLALAKYYEDSKNYGHAIDYYRRVLDQENRSQFKDPELIKTLNEKIGQLLKMRRDRPNEPAAQ